MTREEAIEKGKSYFQKHPTEMVSLYKELYGEIICSYCPGTIAKAFETIQRNIHRPLCKYRIKASVKKISNADGHWTNFNLTDEIAERLISQGYQNSFE